MENIEIKKETCDLHEILDLKPEQLDMEYKIKLEFEESIYLENFDWSEKDCKREFNNTNDVVCYEELIETYPQRCFRCNQIFDNSYSLIKHNLRYLSIKLEQFDDHRQSIHRQELKRNNNNNCLVSKSFHKCHICQKDFIYKHWHFHMRSVHNKSVFKCQECETVYRCRKYLQQHINNIHRANAKFKCDQCSKVFTTKDKYKKHVKNVHSDGVFKCHICNSQLKSEPYLRTHMQRVHYSDGKKHTCNCGKSFKSPRYLNVHKKNRGHL